MKKIHAAGGCVQVNWQDSFDASTSSLDLSRFPQSFYGQAKVLHVFLKSLKKLNFIMLHYIILFYIIFHFILCY